MSVHLFLVRVCYHWNKYHHWNEQPLKCTMTQVDDGSVGVTKMNVIQKPMLQVICNQYIHFIYCIHFNIYWLRFGRSVVPFVNWLKKKSEEKETSMSLHIHSLIFLLGLQKPRNLDFSAGSLGIPSSCFSACSPGISLTLSACFFRNHAILLFLPVL